MSAFTSIDSATGPLDGDARQLAKATAHHTMIVTIDGTVTTVKAYLEGSHDGARWTPISTYQSPQSGMCITQPTAALMTYIRCRLVTLIGPDNPTFSASIASADDI